MLSFQRNWAQGTAISILRLPISHSSRQLNNKIIARAPRVMASNSSTRQNTSQRNTGGTCEGRHPRMADPQPTVTLRQINRLGRRDKCPRGWRARRKCPGGKS